MLQKLVIIAIAVLVSESAFAAPTKMAVLSGTETTAVTLPNDLNQSTPYAIKWSSNNFDPAYFDHSTSSFAHQVRVKVGGDYRLSFTMPVTLNNTSSNRRAILGEIYVNGSAISVGRMASSYIRQASGHNESSLHTVVLLEGLNANDNISIYVNQATNQTGEVTTAGAQLFLEYIDSARTIFMATGTQTTNSTNFNQATAYEVEWSEQVKDTGFTHSDASVPEDITLDAAGDYLVFVNIPYESSGCSVRNSPKALVRLDGATVTSGIATQGYLRCLENHDKSSVHWAGIVTSVSASQVLSIATQRETTNSTATVVPSGREASIFIEKVDTTSDYISVTGTSLLSGTNWNPSAGSEVKWDTQNIFDSSTYSHNTGIDNHKITVDTSGSFFLIYNDHLTATAARANPKARILVNNSAVTTGVCQSHYIRNTEGHNESSCSLTHFLADLEAGDEVSVELKVESVSGTVNDSNPALLTLIRVADADPPSCTGVLECTPDKVLHVDGNTFSSVLDASARDANDVSFSGTVDTWEDISESNSAHDLTQTTAASRPSFDTTTGGLTFDGTNDHFDVADHADLNLAASLKERSIIVAFTTGSDVTSRQVIYEEGGTVRGMNVYIRGGNLYIGFWNNTNDGDGVQGFTSSSTAVSANTNYYASLVIDYSNYTGGGGPDGELRGHINGTKFTAIGTTTSLLYAHSGDIGVGAMINDTYFDDGTSSGDGHYFGGDLYELIIYNHAIDDTEAVDFYNYLKDRWPDPHPMTNVGLDSQYTSVNTTTPNITWTASVSPDINRYEVALGTTAGDNSVSDWASVGTATNTTIGSLTLSECVDYFASVRAVDDDSNVSPDSSTEFIRYDGTDPTDPSGLSVSGSSSTTISKTLSWTASTDSCGFSHYEAAIGTTSGGQEAVAWTDIGNVSSYQFTGIAPALATATNYYTSVRAYDLAGNVSAVVTSAAWQVDTCVATDLTDPTDPGSFVTAGEAGPTTSPSQTWTASTDACGFSHYELSIGTSAAATDIKTWTNVGDVLSHKFFSLSPSLATNTNYYTNIKAVDLAGNESAVVSTSAWQLPTPGGVSSGLVLWLDASDNSTVYSDAGCSVAVTNGGSIQCWGDKSTSANDATAAGTARPTWQDSQFNNEAVVRFDGTDDAVDFTAITDIRTVFVVNKSDTSSYQQILGHTTSRDFYTSNAVLIGATISSSDLRTGSWRVDQVDVSSPTTFTQTGSYSLVSVISGANVEANHIASDQKTAGRFFDGDVAEVIIYNRALTSTEVDDVETYLYNKWFTANPPAVTGLDFDNAYTASSSQSPSFSWTHSTAPDLDHYEVALGYSAGSNDIAGWTTLGLVDTYQYLGQSLPECTDFYASVRAIDTDSYVSSVASTSMGRYDGTDPTAASSLVLSGTAAPATSKTLSWSASSDACSLSHYEVALGTTSGGNEVEDWTNIGNVLTHQFTSISPTLSYATDYYISVRAMDSAGNTSPVAASIAWQLDSCVATDVTAPSVPSGFSTSGQATVTKSKSVSWSPSSDACAFSHYEIGIGTSSGAVNTVGYTNIGDVTTYQFENLGTNLSFGQNYYLTVRAVDEAGNPSAGASSAVWTVYQPGDVSTTGLDVWLDANDLTSLYQNSACSTAVTSNNDSVGCMKDKSGNDSHATNATGSNQPQYKTASFNGFNSVYFDGATDRFLDFGSHTTIRTVFWVLKEDVSNPGNTAFLLGDPGGATNDFHRASTLGAIFSSGNASASVTGGTLQQNGTAITGTTANMPSNESVLSLVTTGNTTASAFSRDRTSCCGSRTWGGSLAELIIFNRALSGTEVTDVENYLMTKWGISAGTTEWTGSTDTDWFTAGNWSNGVPTANQDCVIDNKTNDPTISGGTGICKNIDIGDGVLTLAAGTDKLQIFGNFQSTGTITQNSGPIEMVDDGNIATDQTFQSSATISKLRFDKSAGGSVTLVDSSLTINDLSIASGNTFDFVVPDGKVLVLPNGMSMASATFDVEGGGEVQVGSAQTVTVTGGTFKTSGTNDAFPQTTTNKALLTRQGASGRWAFSATAGSVSLTGFLIDYIDSSGLVINGSANLTALDGGQFTNLNQDYATPVKAIQINTTSSLTETMASNVGFNWGAANGNHSGTPDPSDNYYLVSAPACNNSALVFDLWFGDFFAAINDPVTEDKIFDQDDGGSNCQISMSISASPVTLVSFDAYPYDESAVLSWETGAEINHLGFNVLRSESMYTGYTQINPSIILNFNNSTLFRGNYHFVDENLTNGKTYYYMLEDISIDGVTERHGPVAVTPDGALGAAPSQDPDSNTTPEPPPVSADLGEGVTIVTQTQGSLRLEVIPAAIDVSDAAWSAIHKNVYIPGYSKTLEPGHPELLSRKILIEVDAAYTSVDVVEVTLDSSSITAALLGEKVTPAPDWTDNGSGNLVAQYAEDSGSYADNSFLPAAYYSVSSAAVKINGKNYIEVNVWPLSYSAGTNALSRLDHLVIDIGLDGQAWETSPPSDSYVVAPASVEGGVRIKYGQEGMYEFSYDDLVTNQVEGTLAGVSVGDLRLYYHGTEIPIEVIDGDGLFNSGDSLRFYGPYADNLEDELDEVVLSKYDLGGVDYAPVDDPGALRFTETDNQAMANPVPAVLEETVLRVAEQNNTPLFDVPIGGIVDRFYWRRIWIAGGGTPDANAQLDFNIDLDKLITNTEQMVKVRVHLRGLGVYAKNPTHSLGIYLNAEAVVADKRNFTSNVATVVEFEFDSSRFLQGTNSFRLEALGEQINAGDWEMLDINKIEFEYRAKVSATSGALKLKGLEQGQQVIADGFSSANINVYDYSDYTAAMKYSNLAIDDLGGFNWLVQFDSYPGEHWQGGKDIYMVEDGSFLTPDSFVMAVGSVANLRDPANRGEYLVVGHSSLLDAAYLLTQHREAQGLDVMAVSFDEIEAEFSNGRRSSYGLRDFIKMAVSTWEVAPKYLLLLGDATYDPNDYLSNGVGRSLVPVAIENGQHVDFGSDNFYVELGSDHMPSLAVGRLPSNDPLVIAEYVEKLLAYESGARSPSGASAKKGFFISGEDDKNEGFAGELDKLADNLLAVEKNFSAATLHRQDYTNDADAKVAIKDQFNSGSLMVTFLGHGAEDLWGSDDMFNVDDVKALDNNELPIVVALNCLNSYYYDPDSSYKSLGEEMVFNADGGAVAFWGSTSVTSPHAQSNLATSLYSELAQKTSGVYEEVRLGDLMLNAKLGLGVEEHAKDTVKSYILFGDPALMIPQESFSGKVASSNGEELSSVAPASSGGGGGCAAVAADGSNGKAQGFLDIARELMFFLFVLLVWSACRANLRRES